MVTPFNPTAHTLYCSQSVHILQNAKTITRVCCYIPLKNLYAYTDVSLLHLLVIYNLKIQPDGMFCNVHA